MNTTPDGQIPGQLHIPTAAYGHVPLTRNELDQELAAEGMRPVGIGEPHAWRAFRDELTGGER